MNKNIDSETLRVRNDHIFNPVYLFTFGTGHKKVGTTSGNGLNLICKLAPDFSIIGYLVYRINYIRVFEIKKKTSIGLRIQFLES